MCIVSRKRINSPLTISPTKARKQTVNPKVAHSSNQKQPPNSTIGRERKFCAETARLLNSLRQWLHNYVVITPEQGNVIAAWTLHDWAIDAADFTPYLNITAPEKGCGKSRLLEVLEHVVREPCRTGGMSAAALVRTVDSRKPTLLLDELDATFGGDKEVAENLRGILNEGFRRGGIICKCVGPNHEVKEFQVFGPKVLTGIGKLPDTIASRCIVIQMRRKLESERVEAFRIRDVRDAARPLRASLQAWLEFGVIETLEASRPKQIETLSDRQMDISEPLLAIADMAGGEWPAILRESLTVLFRSAAASDASHGTTLLRDIRSIFTQQNGKAAPWIFTTELVASLNAIEESPWAEWNHGREMTPSALAKMLKKYEITPKTVRIGASTSKGYKREAFIDALKRYVTPLEGESSDAS